MEIQDELLQRFTKMIDLPAFVGAQGFQVADRQEPDRLCMTNPSTGEILLLAKDVERGGWTYASTTDPLDRGTVVAFITRRDGASREACVDRLIACCDERGRGSAEAMRYRTFLREMPDELRSACRTHEQTKLEQLAATKALDRLGVPRGTLDEWRFGALKCESDISSLTAEPKVLWASRYRAEDKAIVLVERPIDAIAYERAHGHQSVCYIATGSNPAEVQRKTLAHILAEVPAGTHVVLAYGRDEAGRRLAAEVQALAPLGPMERHVPTFGCRWAEQMQLEARHAKSLERGRDALER